MSRFRTQPSRFLGYLTDVRMNLKEISSNLLKVPVKMALREKITGLVAARLSRLLSFKGRVGRTKVLSYPRLHPSSPLHSTPLLS
jgi:hypothetical protein